MKHLLALILVTVFATASFADDAPANSKKVKSSWQVMKLKKSLEPVNLTEEQEIGLAQTIEKYSATLAELEAKGLTKDKLKTRAAKQKEGRETGLKGKELKARVAEGFSEDEIGMFKELDQATKTAERTVAKMLTEEQLSSLPEKAQKRMSMLRMQGKGGKGSGKKNMQKEAAAQ